MKETDTTIIVSGSKGGISEATLNMMAKAHDKIGAKISQSNPDDYVIVQPKASLLPDLEYIGDGKYRFKKQNKGDEQADGNKS